MADKSVPSATRNLFEKRFLDFPKLLFISYLLFLILGRFKDVFSN